MASAQNSHRQRDDLQKLYNLLEQKIVRLRTAKVIETDPAILFKIDMQIEEAEAERSKFVQEIEDLDKVLGQENNSPS